MKIFKFTFLFFLLFSGGFASATHLVGGFMSYRYIGQNGTNTTYRVKLYVYRDCTKDGTTNQVPFDDYITLCVYNRGNDALVTNYTIRLTEEKPVDPVGNTACPELANACLKRGIYDGQIVVPNSNVGYKLKWERCCRNTQTNLRDGISGDPDQGQTYYAEIPATALKNSSPEFLDVPVPFICAKDTTVVRNRAVDANGDSLTYRFVTPWQGASTANPLPDVCDNKLKQPFNNVEYLPGYSANLPFGAGGINTIDPLNGLTTYLAPKSGRYAIAIEVTEWRAGVAISKIRLDLQILVIDCKPNNKPRLYYQGGTSTWYVDAGDQICRDVSAIDDKDQQDKVTIKGYGDVLTGANGFTGTKGTLTPSPASGIRLATTRFCWKTDCSHASPDPYVITFEAFDDGCPSKFINENVLIYVRPFTPPETITGPGSVCQNSKGVVYSINNKQTGNTYKWSVSGGTLAGDSTQNTVAINWGNSSSGEVYLWITSKFGCTVGPRIFNVNLRPAPQKPKISGLDTLCLNSTVTYNSSADPGVTYTWSVFGGSIVGSNKGATANIRWTSAGNAYAVLEVTNVFGCTSPPDTFLVFVSHPSTGSIQGPGSICPNNKGIVYKISNPSAGSVYRWFVTGGIQSSGGMGSTITIDWGGKGLGVIKAVEINRFGCVGDTVYKNVIVDHSLTGQLPAGDTSICEFTKNVGYSITPVKGETYQWTVTGGTIIAGQGTNSIIVDWGATGSGSVGVQTSAWDSVNNQACLSPVRARMVNIRPVPNPKPMSGIFELCQQKQNGIFSITGFPNSTFEWEINGLNFTGQGTNSVSVFHDTYGSFKIRVREKTEYGCLGPWNDSTITIHPKPRTSPITGEETICVPYLSNHSYSVTGFNNSIFNWNIDGGNIVTGSGTPSIVADWNGQQYSKLLVQEVSEYGCIGDTIKLDVFVDNPKIECRLVTVNPPPGSDESVLIYYNLTNAPRYNQQIVIQRRLRGSALNFGTIGLAAPSGVLFTDNTALTDSNSYEYRAVAINLCGDSIYSNSNTDILLKGIKTGPFSYRLNFTDYLNWPGGADRYELYRLLENKSDYILLDVFGGPSTKDYDNGKEHYGMWFRIKAIESGGLNRESWSNDVKVYFEPLIYVPNVFTPDKNGLNDRFLPNSGGMKTYTLRIFNRWGEKMFETDNNEIGWNGEYNNKPAPEGVYVYVIDYTDFRNREYQAKGTLHLLR